MQSTLFKQSLKVVTAFILFFLFLIRLSLFQVSVSFFASFMRTFGQKTISQKTPFGVLPGCLAHVLLLGARSWQFLIFHWWHPSALTISAREIREKADAGGCCCPCDSRTPTRADQAPSLSLPVCRKATVFDLHLALHCIFCLYLFHRFSSTFYSAVFVVLIMSRQNRRGPINDNPRTKTCLGSPHTLFFPEEM